MRKLSHLVCAQHYSRKSGEYKKEKEWDRTFPKTISGSVNENCVNCLLESHWKDLQELKESMDCLLVVSSHFLACGQIFNFSTVPEQREPWLDSCNLYRRLNASLTVLSCFLQLPSFTLCKVDGWHVTCLHDAWIPGFASRMKKWTPSQREKDMYFHKWKEENLAQPDLPHYLALALTPGRVKSSPPTLQTHCVLSISVPLNRLFSRPLTLFPLSTDFQI